jgi:membrane-bound lytic murein transglycosylase MltF
MKKLFYQLKKPYLYLFLLGALWIFGVGHSGTTEVIYPRQSPQSNIIDADFIEILRLSLEKTTASDGPFTLRPTTMAMNPSRFMYELKNGREPNIAWANVTQAREQHFLPIRIPLRKGLQGFHVFLIKKQDQDKFSAITALEPLKKLRAAQRTAYIDTLILKRNGFKMTTAFHYEGLFKMLMAQRVDYFPRAVIEADVELHQKQKRYPDMTIEKTILLYYPLPKYFWVNKNNVQLAERVKRGLNIMLKDGSFEQLFMKYHQHHLDTINSRQNKVFIISNPFLPETVPFERRELWLYLFDHQTH